MEHVKLREKIGYGLGDAASSMFWKLFTMYLLFFYTDVVGISAAVVGSPKGEQEYGGLDAEVVGKHMRHS